MTRSIIEGIRGAATVAPAPSDGQAEVLTTKVGLQLATNLTYDRWERAGQKLAGVLSSSSWWLGDWMNYGREHYSDRYERGVEAAGLRYQTLRNYAWVAGRFPMSRRLADLSFQHHAEVASFPPDEQERWLQHSLEQKWSLKKLRAAIKQSRMSAVPMSRRSDELRLAFPGEQARRWLEAANQSGIEVEQWVLATLDQAAEDILAA
jgi:hypothetical protein